MPETPEEKAAREEWNRTHPREQHASPDDRARGTALAEAEARGDPTAVAQQVADAKAEGRYTPGESWYDLVPGLAQVAHPVDTIKGIGNALAQTPGGKIVVAGAKALGGGLKSAFGDVSSAPTEADKARNLALYNRALGIKAPDPVSYNLDPNVERVDGIADVTAPQMAPVERVGAQSVNPTTIDQTGSNQIRGQQLGLAKNLTGAIDGSGPSVAENLFAAKQQDIARDVHGVAAQARGSDRAYARLTAMRTLADQQRRAAADSGMIRAQEIATARGQLGGVLSDARGTDASLATGQAGLTQHAAVGNADRALTADVTSTRAANEAAIEAARQKMEAERLNQTTDLSAKTTNADAFNRRGETIATNTAKVAEGNRDSQQRATEFGQTAGQTASNAATGNTNTALDVESRNKDRKAGIATGIIGGLATAGTGILSSDPRAKTDIERHSDREVDKSLRALEMYSYRYKDGEGPPGPRHGPMSDDLRKDPILRTAVKTGPDGKDVVDTSALSLIMTGLTARKFRELEGRR